VDSALEQVDEPRSSCGEQCREKIVDIYLIVSPCGLNDRVVGLDELFRVAKIVILVD
jgi:hypothetical protein